jgi:phage N-6-adenine-methyltransferase
VKGHATLMSKASDEWSTPQDFFDVVNAELGPFTLDAAATYENTKAAAYFDYSMDALRHPWGGRTVWLNPPYSRVGAFMAKAAHESINSGSLVVCLVPARTDTRWWHRACVQADEVRLLKGRLKFGDSNASAPFPSALFVYRPDPDWRVDGMCIRNWDWRTK